MMTDHAIGAVVVAYHPEPERLGALLDQLGRQLDRILVIDNDPDGKLSLPDRAGLTVQSSGENLGVAEAINRGIDQLIEEGVGQALLMDQDSLIDAELVATLSQHLDSLERKGQRVAAIGPRIRDHDDQSAAPFMRFRLPFNQRLQGDRGCVPCDFLITSGCLINLDHWTAIGPMRSAWFIDNIDLEWCFRAQRKGYAIVGCFETTLDHRIGERARLFGLIPYRRHAPQRLYTMMRNRVFLYRSGAPVAFVVQDAIRAIGKLVLFSLIPPRRAHLGRMLAGLRDGLRTRPVP
jgi:rhamnosyltransferase